MNLSSRANKNGHAGFVQINSRNLSTEDEQQEFFLKKK